MPHISQLKESKYLKKEDCTPPILVTITDCDQTDIALDGDPPEMKWTVHFREVEKPLILNSTNAQLIARITGSEQTEEWTGKQVVLFNDPNVSFGGKLVGGIRVRASKMNRPLNPEPDDEVPF